MSSAGARDESALIHLKQDYKAEGNDNVHASEDLEVCPACSSAGARETSSCQTGWRHAASTAQLVGKIFRQASVSRAAVWMRPPEEEGEEARGRCRRLKADVKKDEEWQRQREPAKRSTLETRLRLRRT
eukprot:5653568-Pleurochrysis_carterae.AAC.1